GARLRQPRMGSNGWAIGRERSAAGGGLLLSNTHFPAVGEKQWFESHLTLPGVLDVYGASLIGVPITNVGFNAHVAWTHTVSYAPRFVAYALALDPADPTRYRYGDGWESMVGAERRVEVLGEDGEVATSTRTTWRSRYGPVFAAPIVGWTPQLAFTYRDVNAVDAGMFDVWYGMATATSLAELQEAHARSQGIPWVYTLAADAEGAAWFADTSRVPDLSASSIAGWRALQAGGGAVGLLASQFAAYGAILLVGADPGNAWVEDPRAVEPGLVPFEDAPQIERSDYVFNANDSPWLANARAPLLGYDEALYGAARTPRSARTRMNGRYLDEVGPGSASGDDGRFSLEEVEAAALSMRSSIAEVALDDVLASACGAPEGDLAVACDALAGWDGRYTADARGPVIWRLFLTAFEVDDLVDGGGGLLVVPFDPDDPLGTPRGVTADVERLQHALRGAAGWAAELPGDGVPTLGEVQRLALDDGSAVGVPGGQFWEGTIGVADWWQDGTRVALPRFQRPEIVEATSEMTAEGWWVNDGNSFILAVAFEAGAPRARAVMTYGPTDDPRSPLVHGQPELYASGALRPVWFSEADVAAHVVEEVTRSR
ncbi:MAG TPA: penicillin acylase family protein, partial [Myxococcota bacterium]|nr:penicillin acylase family protein [Myxococcota bacterium]